MARRLRIPRLVPDGMGSARLQTHCERRRSSRTDGERLTTEPWRRTGYGSAYRKARQAAIARTGGRCAACGRQVARQRQDGTWSCDLGGQTHHIKPLCDNGKAEGNLVLLCPACHSKADRVRRQGIGV